MARSVKSLNFRIPKADHIVIFNIRSMPGNVPESVSEIHSYVLKLFVKWKSGFMKFRPDPVFLKNKLAAQ